MISRVNNFPSIDKPAAYTEIKSFHQCNYKSADLGWMQGLSTALARPVSGYQGALELEANYILPELGTTHGAWNLPGVWNLP